MLDRRPLLSQQANSANAPPEVRAAIEVLDREAIPRARCAKLLAGVMESSASQTEIVALKDRLHGSHGEFHEDSFERALVIRAFHHHEQAFRAAPVEDSVYRLVVNEYVTLHKPRRASEPPVVAGSNGFVVLAKIATLRRFPAGPLDWEISGFPRSWLFSVPKTSLPSLLRMLFGQIGGLKPLFFEHVALAPRNRGLVIEKEVLRCYYRMARSIARQPRIKGLMAAAWFHHPDWIRQRPHLACLSEPYLQHGGMIVPLAVRGDPAPGEPELLDDKPRQAVALWPRDMLLNWADAHPDLAA